MRDHDQDAKDVEPKLASREMIEFRIFCDSLKQAYVFKMP